MSGPPVDELQTVELFQRRIERVPGELEILPNMIVCLIQKTKYSIDISHMTVAC